MNKKLFPYDDNLTCGFDRISYINDPAPVEIFEGKRNIIRSFLEEYDIETAEDIQDALKDLLGGAIKEMMEAEMDDHLGYEKSQVQKIRNNSKRTVVLCTTCS